LAERALKTWLVATVAATIGLGSLSSGASAGTLYTDSGKQLAALTIGQDGLLTPVEGSPFQFDDYPSGIAVTPDGMTMITSFLFDFGLGTQSIAANGALSPLRPPLDVGVISSAAVSPDGSFAYASSQAGGVLAFRIGTDGSLTQVGGEYGTVKGGVTSVTPDGRFVLIPGFLAGSIERLAVQPDGSLNSLGTKPVGPGPLYLHTTPDGRFAILLKDPLGPGEIGTFAVGPDGSLTATGSALATTGETSGKPVLAPNGRFFYNPNRNEDSITAYSVSETGLLSQLGPPTPAGVQEPGSLAMSVDGRFLYVVPYTGMKAQAFSVAADGSLTKIGGPASTGAADEGTTAVVRPAAPTARFEVSAAAPGQQSSFDASASSDAGATLTNYAWDFGDGTKLAGGSPQVTHAYSKAGVYDVTLTVGDSAGCVGFVHTGNTAYCNARDATTTLKLDTLPAISRLRVTNRKFAAASISRKKTKRGTTFRYTLSEPARVVFTVRRKRIGRRVGGRCRPRTRRNASKRRCRLLTGVGSFAVNGKGGKNSRRFSGKLRRRPLKPGSYTATAIATDAAGGRSAPRTVTFTVLRRKR
jgi:6-phosphogluconolactonase